MIIFQNKTFDRMESAGLRGRIKKSGLFSHFRDFSEAFPLLDINMHELTLICGQKLRIGDRLWLQLQTPQGLSIDLHAEVIQLRQKEGKFRVVTIKFMPFGEGIMGNSYQSLILLQNILTLFEIPYQ